MSLESAYDRGTFEWYKEFKDDYFAIADALASIVSGKCALDIGCGSGYILERLWKNHKVITKGIEGSSGCIGVISRDVREGLSILDVSKPFFVGKWDLVICLEVGEHLAEEAADTLVNNIFNHCASCGFVYFSAATPGQGGHLHLNEQPHEYWIEKFHARGFSVHGERSLHMSNVAGKTRLSWLRDNGMIFRRGFGV